jgi:hypothetical protein
MKSLVIVLLSFFISCSQPNRADVDKDIKLVLSSLSDSIRANGITGWIPFLEKSKEFKWISMGSTVTYDSLIARIQRKDSDIGSFTISWDSVRIEFLTKNEVKLFAIVTEVGIVSDGEQAAVTIEVKGNLRKIDGSWKFHTCEMSMYEPPQPDQNVAIADTSRQTYNSLDSLIKSQHGSMYHVMGILDVDDRTKNAAYRIYQDMGYTFEDPNHQLEHSFIVAVGKYEENGRDLCDSGSIAIIRQNKIVWFSKPLIHHFDYAPLPGFGDLNNDGTTDILFSAQIDMRGYGEALWILSPDSSGGRLLNDVDEDKQSTIIGASSCFKISQQKGENAKRIEVDDLDSESHGKFIYIWNGRIFTKQTIHNSQGQ